MKWTGCQTGPSGSWHSCLNSSDIFKSTEHKLDPFNIQKGQTVVDYGSGTGRYLRKASELVGENGWVYAVDIQELAIDEPSE